MYLLVLGFGLGPVFEKAGQGDYLRFVAPGVVVMPIFSRSRALYPLSTLPAALTVLTRLDPLSYGVDGLRGAFIGLSHFGVWFDLAVLGVLAVCFLALGARAFARIQV